MSKFTATSMLEDMNYIKSECQSKFLNEQNVKTCTEIIAMLDASSAEGKEFKEINECIQMLKNVIMGVSDSAKSFSASDSRKVRDSITYSLNSIHCALKFTITKYNRQPIKDLLEAENKIMDICADIMFGE